MKQLNTLLVCLAVILCVVLLRSPKGSGGASSPQNTSTTAQALPADPQDSDIPRPQKKTKEPADALLSDDLSIRDKLVVFERFFMDYLSAHRSLPSGTQQEVYHALTGNNPKGIAYIPPDHPITKSQDYTFHSLSSKAIEIIHRGEDGLFYSEDDVKSSPFASVEVRR